MRNWKAKAAFGLFAVMALGAATAWHYRVAIRAQLWKLSLPETLQVQAGGTRFAVIGDYGGGGLREWQVALMVDSWKPDFIVTVGDNNYPVGSTETIDKNVGRFYHEYIFPYKGRYGDGASENRFFPIAGHRDWDTDSLKPYLAYFTLPGNERYYDLVRGPVHFFMLDTDHREPDGATAESVQGQWLKEELARSTSTWNLVFAHHAPYTSHTVQDTERMRWPFKQWGADAIFSGFYHVYERLEVDGIPYFVDGTGGATVSQFGELDSHSKFRYNADFGALIADADTGRLVIRYVNRAGKVIDELTLTKDAGPDSSGG